ncbi:MFS transporter [Gallaecimonas kandeliae]|uniref:MFS transporter n=1 Tax=Gallaecimonas kandeliae TaxID=3029055 RepID=UPI002649293C|nr:MFS transporter [Gallaecimonas kandeliae]WKE64610.1 MFS transporter [Gallaecimonas kandeliae]
MATESKLSRPQLKVLALSALGGALEFYDFIIFVFFAKAIGQLFFPPEMPDWLRQLQTFGLFAAGYLARPLGGVILAHFGDLVGRKKMFTLSIFLMSVPTLLIGCLPTYGDWGLWAPLALLFMRILQGAAVGGEVPGAWVFVSEHAGRRHLGLACGSLTAGLVGGILLGSLMAVFINGRFGGELLTWAWRIPFLVGGLFGLFAVYLRQYLHETPVFAELEAKRALAAELPLKLLLRGHKGQVLLAMAVTWLLTGAVVVVILMTPTLIQAQAGIGAVDAFSANALATLAVMLGAVLAGHLSDRLGPGPVLAAFSLLLVASYGLMMTLLPLHPGWLKPLYALAGFGVGITGVIPAIAVAAFPAPIRFTGLSFSYNLAYAIFGGFTPILVSLLVAWHPLGPLAYLGALGLMGLGLGFWLWPRGRAAEAGLTFR